MLFFLNVATTTPQASRCKPTTAVRTERACSLSTRTRRRAAPNCSCRSRQGRCPPKQAGGHMLCDRSGHSQRRHHGVLIARHACAPSPHVSHLCIVWLERPTARRLPARLRHSQQTRISPLRLVRPWRPRPPRDTAQWRSAPRVCRRITVIARTPIPAAGGQVRACRWGQRDP